VQQEEMLLKRDAVIIGAGRIGRGFLAEMFLDAGCNITFADTDHSLIDALNRAGSYRLMKTSGKTDETVEISGYRAIYADNDSDMLDALCRENAIAAVAVPADALGQIAEVLAIALARRTMEHPQIPLDILVCVNTMSPAARLRSMLDSMLGGAALSYLRNRVGLINTVLLRVAPFPPKQMLLEHPLMVLDNGYPSISVDAAAFCGLPLRSKMVRLSDNIRAEDIRRIYTLNMAHATAAYIGVGKGYLTLNRAMEDEQVRREIVGALEESAAGLCSAFGFDAYELHQWNGEILEMMRNPLLDDGLIALGADTSRKLSLADRLVGPAVLAMRAGVSPVHLANAIAYGYLFSISRDSGTMRCQQLLGQRGIVAALEIISGIDIKHPLQNLLLEAYYSAKDELDQKSSR
jgi:mannitol-1-phosphate 5-dehydrogenase